MLFARRTRLATIALTVVPIALAALGCSGAPIAPKVEATSPKDAFGGLNCNAVRPQTEPDLMGWDPASRANLNVLRSEGVIAVRYQADGCDVELEVLSNCIGRGEYSYSPYAATDTKIAHDASELYAALPIGAARLSGKVKGGRALRADYMLAGVAALPAGSAFDRRDLRGGDCARATHVVSKVYLGGFAMMAGESSAIDAAASVFGAEAGGSAVAQAERVATEGSAEACREAQGSGRESRLCAVPLRIGLLPLDAAAAQALCPEGATWNGEACVRSQVVTSVTCPASARWDGARCVPNAPTPTQAPSPALPAAASAAAPSPARATAVDTAAFAPPTATCAKADWTPRRLAPLLRSVPVGSVNVTTVKASPERVARTGRHVVDEPAVLGRFSPASGCSDSPSARDPNTKGRRTTVSGVEIEVLDVRDAGKSGRGWSGGQCSYGVRLAGGAGPLVTLGAGQVPPFNELAGIERAGSAAYATVQFNGYAREAPAGNNRIVALDLCEGKVKWTSKDRVSNGPLMLLGDYVVSTYGFTAEPDFLYVHDARTGAVVQKLAIPSAASRMLLKGDVLVVETYDQTVAFKVAGR